MVLYGSRLMSRSRWSVSFDLLVHAICMCFFKGGSIILLLTISCAYVVIVLFEVAVVLQSKSINLFRDAVTGVNLSQTTDHMCLLHSLEFGGCIQ